MKQRAARGEPVDARDIRKHANDVLRFSQLLAPETRIQAAGNSFAEEFPDYRFRKHIGSVTAARTCNDVFDEFLVHVESRVVKA
ncbi:MAG TPA: hypothetical protein VII70_01460 [Steroidobacteraceae bacterium]